MIVGHTSGGAPIHFGGSQRSPKKARPRFKCSSNEGHKLTSAQAKASGWKCTHCGADLRVRKEKMREMYALAEALGYTVSPD